VLPFKYRGPPDDAYIADALTDELIDALSMTRGLKVPASGATAKFANDRDPKRVGEALAVQAFVDGSVQTSGPKIRISARLVDTKTGLQTWSEHYDGDLVDVFEFQDRMAKRIAETLRVELSTLVHRGAACADAIALYLRARRKQRGQYAGQLHEEDNPVVLFERCLELAPDFAPAMAGHALACIMAWFLPGFRGQRDWAEASRNAVARALEQAPDLAETHYAAARLAAQCGDYADAARRLATALEIAPTYADAHEYLGTLQAEGGRIHEGIQHIELAIELDPTLSLGRVLIARHQALHGNMEAYERNLARLKDEYAATTLPLALLEMRVAAWTGDFDRARRAASWFESFEGTTVGNVAKLAHLYFGESCVEELERDFAPRDQDNPRFMALLYQMLTEALCIHDRPDRGLNYLQLANAKNLVDLDWIDHCPAIVALRPTAEFSAVRQQVARRARGIWTR
jgi:serine/threonine-protein kinase